MTSSVSSGRWYIQWMIATSSSEAQQAGDEERDREAIRIETSVLVTTCWVRYVGVGAGHEELAVRHVDDAHLAEGQREAERRDEQDRAGRRCR